MNRITKDSILRRSIVLGLLAALLCLFAVAACSDVTRDSQGRPLYVDRQMILTVATGTSQAGLDQTLDEIGAQLVRKLSVRDTYLVELLPTRDAETSNVEEAVTRSRSVTRIVDAAPNYYAYPCVEQASNRSGPLAIPTDPLWFRMWNMRMIGMEAAWDVVKGSPSIVVAVLDDGLSTTHPEFQGRIVFPRDTADNDFDVTPTGAHGTHVAGTVAAQGGNNEGLVGVCWNGVKIMPVKVFGDDEVGATTDAFIEGLDWAKNNGAHVVNISLGIAYHPARNPPEALRNKLRELDNLGIILVAAAGNESVPGQAPARVGWPARWPECIAVSSVDHTEAMAAYSCQEEGVVDIAAPGGAWLAPGDPNGVWSTWFTPEEGNGYESVVGTSMAAPHVAGAAALLLSAGVPAQEVKSRLYAGARQPRNVTWNPAGYGAGILNVYNSLIGGGDLIRIEEPANGSVVDTVSPNFRISYSGIIPETLTVYLNYPDANNDGVPDDLTQRIIIGPENISEYLVASSPGTLEFRLPMRWLDTDEPLDTLEPGAHRIYVRAQRSDGSAVPASARGVFFVSPHVVGSGLRLFSIPYPLPPNTRPEDIFGTTSFSLSRLDPEYAAITGEYAAWSTFDGFTDVPNKYAWPTEEATDLIGITRYTLKRGSAFWLRATEDLPVTLATQANREACVVRLVGPVGGDSDMRKGWNMVGNPFPFRVDWANVKLAYRGRTLPVVEAAAAGWIRPNIFRYNPRSGYNFQTAPQGVLVPWEGHWVYAEVGSADDSDPRNWLLMTIPPLESHAITREATVGRAGSSSDTEWRISLSARCGDWIDGHNMLGVSQHAADGYGLEDVVKPPLPPPSPVSLAFVHRDWGERSGAYQSDIRNSAGTSKTWDVEVRANVENQDITLSWPDIGTVPKTVSLTLEDVSSGSKIYMRTRSSYTYNSGSGGIRRFKLTAEPETKGRLIISNIGVTRNRAGSLAITYSVSREARVEVRIRNAAGKAVRSLGGSSTRAAGLGTIIWDTRGEDGQSVPTGPYLCEIIAAGPDGEVVKTVQPILLR